MADGHHFSVFTFREKEKLQKVAHAHQGRYTILRFINDTIDNNVDRLIPPVVITFSVIVY